jgi:hypothetical protein
LHAHSKLVQLTVNGRHGDNGVDVQHLVEVEENKESDLVRTPHPPTVVNNVLVKELIRVHVTDNSVLSPDSGRHGAHTVNVPVHVVAVRCNVSEIVPR